MADEFSVGRVLGATRDTLIKGAPLLLAFAVPLIVLPEMAAGWYAVEQGDDASAFRISNLLSITVELFAQIAMVRVAMQILAGKRADFGDGARIGAAIFFPALGINVLAGTAILLGLILLLIPGIFLGVSWSMTLPERIQNGPGVTRAMRASWKMTAPARWKILGLYGLFALSCLPLLAVYGFAFPTPNLISEAVFTPLIVVFVSVGNAVLAASIYHELRPQGRIEDQTAEIFA